MYKKLTWGLGVLVILLCTAFVFMTVLNRAEIRQLKEEAAEAEKLSEDRNKHLVQQPDVGNKPPGPAQEGFEWEWHGDHWHEMPIAQNDPPHEPHSENPTSQTESFRPSVYEGKSLYDKVAASDDVPKYSELKLMTQEELGELMKASDAKAKSFDAEVEKRRDAFLEAPIGSDKAKALDAALDAILREQFIHEATARKAFKVLNWRFILHLQEKPLPNLIIMPIPEPFDP